MPDVPREYLQQHLEPESNEAQQEVSDRSLLGPDVEYEYKDHDRIEQQIGNRVFKMEYELLAPDRVQRILQTIEAPTAEEQKHLEQLFSAPLRVVNEWSLSDLERGTKVDLDSLRANRIPFLRVDPTEGSSKVTDGIIMINGDLTKVQATGVLFHELGHIHTGSEWNVGRDKLKQRSLITAQEGAALLLDERNAWAWALRQLRTVLAPEEMKIVMEHMHSHGLDSYSKGIRDSLMPQWLEVVQGWYQKLSQRR